MARPSKPKTAVAAIGRSKTAEPAAGIDPVLDPGTIDMAEPAGCYISQPGAEDEFPAEPLTSAQADGVPVELATPPATEQENHYAIAAVQAEVLGFIDGVDGQGRLKGWACVKDRHTQRVEVEIYEGVELLGFGAADQYREDLSGAGLSDGASGFEVQLAQSVLDGTRRTLVIRCEAEKARPLVLDYELAAAPEPAVPNDAAVAITNSHLARVRQLSQTGTAGSPVKASLYVAGQRILTRVPYPMPPYHVSGWYDPEDEFTWIRGYEATIEMYLRSPRRSYTFSAELVPNGVSQQIQTLEIFFNRQRLAFKEVPYRMTVSVEVPREVFTSRISVINLHCRNAVVGSDFGAPDTRRLGIAVASWQLT